MDSLDQLDQFLVEIAYGIVSGRLAVCLEKKSGPLVRKLNFLPIFGPPIQHHASSKLSTHTSRVISPRSERVFAGLSPLSSNYGSSRNAWSLFARCIRAS